MEDAAGGIVILLVYCICLAAFVIPTIAGMWKAFEKAGQPGWASIIPIYNIVVILQIAGKPVWFLVLFFVPVVSVIAPFIVYIPFVERYGKGAGFGILCVFLPFIGFPMLGFGDAQYTPAPTT